jgi:uncharacterized protein YjdB
MRANRKRAFFQGTEILPGQFATGREMASEELGISGSKWYRGMQKLQEMEQIRIVANNRFSVIHIVNWAKYQADKDKSEQRANNQRTTTEQPSNNRRTTDEQPADTIGEGSKDPIGEVREVREGEELIAAARAAAVFKNAVELEIVTAANKFQRAVKTALTQKQIWEVCYIGECLSPGMVSQWTSKILAGEVNKIRNWVHGALRDEYRTKYPGADWRELLPAVPPYRTGETPK